MQHEGSRHSDAIPDLRQAIRAVANHLADLIRHAQADGEIRDDLKAVAP